MMGNLVSENFITQKYLLRYPDSKRAKSWCGRMVHIETENGVWRHEAQGYTWVWHADAWILPFEEAVKQVRHYGPEKKARFILYKRIKYAAADEETFGLYGIFKNA